MKHPFLEMKGIGKRFPGVKALDNVSLSVDYGEALGVVGENGAGKSTLIKILTGAYQRDEGEICIDGLPVQLNTTNDAKNLGINAVYQDIALAPKLSVGENIFLGNLPTNGLGIVNWKKVFKESEQTLSTLNISVNPKEKLENLSAVNQEMIAIAKAYYEKSKLVIFDEPTALLANEEIRELFSMIRRLKDEGVAIIYISHRLEEIFAICDTFAVLRDGSNVTSGKTSEVDERKLVHYMVGRDISAMYTLKRPQIGTELITVTGLSKKEKFHDITFSVSKGEIFGIFGLIGAGRTDIVRCLFGADKATSGEMCLEGNVCYIRTPNDAIASGIGLLPEQRRTQGLALQLSVRENINLPRYKQISPLGVVNKKDEIAISEEYRKRIAIRTPSIDQKVENLSGGNQQKVVISRWLAMNPRLLIFDEPTVGVDVGAKIEIYKLIEEFVNQGMSIIIISSYLPEVIGLSDRVMVIHEGRQMGIFERNELNEERLLEAASGLR
jgi:ribose transport system ATP-binding protein